MAEIMAVVAALGGTAGTAAAGTAAVGTAAAAGTAAAGAASALSVLQGVATAVSVLGAIGGGISAMASANEQAEATELQMGQEHLAGEQRRLSMRRELARILGENDVAFAAGGVDVTSGIAANARRGASEDAAFDMSIDRGQDEYRRALLQVRARGLRRRGGEAMFGGLMQAAGAGLDYKMSLYERGI